MHRVSDSREVDGVVGVVIILEPVLDGAGCDGRKKASSTLAPSSASLKFEMSASTADWPIYLIGPAQAASLIPKVPLAAKYSGNSASSRP
jgi:hypothetical protein